MLLIIEFAFLGFGIYAIITGKMPSFLFGGGKYKAEGTAVRLLGLLLLTPLPIAFLITLILFYLNVEGAAILSSFFELLVVGIVALIGSIISKRIRVSTIQTENLDQDQVNLLMIEEKIRKKTSGALIYTITGLFGVVSIIVCPLAIVYTTQAINLIKKHNVGEDYLQKAIFTRGFAILFLIIYGCLITTFLWVILGSGQQYLM